MTTAKTAWQSVWTTSHFCSLSSVSVCTALKTKTWDVQITFTKFFCVGGFSPPRNYYTLFLIVIFISFLIIAHLDAKISGGNFSSMWIEYGISEECLFWSQNDTAKCELSDLPHLWIFRFVFKVFYTVFDIIIYRWF